MCGIALLFLVAALCRSDTASQTATRIEGAPPKPFFLSWWSDYFLKPPRWIPSSAPWSSLLRGSKGVSFQRTITTFPGNSSFELYFDDQHCNSKDAFGDNHCHYDWSDDVTGDYSILVNETITEAAFMTGTFKVCICLAEGR
jgi:hypothetical protein